MQDSGHWLDNLMANWRGVLLCALGVLVWQFVIGLLLALLGVDAGGWLSFFLGLAGLIAGSAAAAYASADRSAVHGVAVAFLCILANWIVAAFVDIESAANFRGLLVMLLSFPACGIIGAISVSLLVGESELR